MNVNNFMLVSGKMGNYVFCTYRGQQYVRRRPRKREGAPSPKQEAQMERMAAVAIFYRALKEAGLFPYWETAAEGQLAHGYNLLTKENLPAFRAGGYICDFAKLQLTPALLALPDDLRLAQEEDGAWRLQWVNAPFQAGTAEDDRLQVFLMRDEDSFDPLPVETGEVCRKDGIVRFCIPEEWKACGHLYVFFCSQTGWKSSACRYFRMEDFLYANLIMNEYGNLL